MLHVAPEGATRNATAQQAEMLHVAPPRACNTQQHPANERSEPSRTIRDLVEFERLLSIVAPAYDTPASQYQEIRSVAAGDIAAAISAFRIMAKQIQ
jgi:hypothetical protein